MDWSGGCFHNLPSLFQHWTYLSYAYVHIQHDSAMKRKTSCGIQTTSLLGGYRTPSMFGVVCRGERDGIQTPRVTQPPRSSFSRQVGARATSTFEVETESTLPNLLLSFLSHQLQHIKMGISTRWRQGNGQIPQIAADHLQIGISVWMNGEGSDAIGLC